MKNYQITGKAQGHVAEVCIYGHIGTDTSAEDFTTLLRSLGAISRLNIHIKSPGGDVEDGFMILETLDQHSAHIHTYNESEANSMASLILLAGNTRHMAKSAKIQLHIPYAKDPRDAPENELERLIEKITGVYQERTEVSADYAREMMNQEKLLNSQQAKELGFVDNIY